MKVSGPMVKQARKKLKMTQSDLADGICQQPTISHIENKNAVESFSVIFAICERLNLDVNEVIEGKNGFDIENYLNQVDYLCAHNKHQQALELLEAHVPLEKVEDHQKSRALYFYGITHVISTKNYDRAMYYFHKAIELNNDRKYFALAKNGVGTVYGYKKFFELAKDYFESALNLVKESAFSDDKEVIKIYYNTAKVHSDLKDYRKAYEIVDEGLAIARKNKNTFLVDYSMYEKAYSARKLGRDDYQALYFKAKTFAEFNFNTDLLKTIEADLSA